MPELNLSRAYSSTADSILNLFDRTEEGLVIPGYQREYTWEEDNVNQLFDDLLQGVSELVDEQGDNAFSFLGTTILVQPEGAQYLSIVDEDRARPTSVLIVVDGQQRIATVGLLAIQIREKLRALCDMLPDDHPYSLLKSHYKDTIDNLAKLYSVEVKRDSQPPQKPKIIRQLDDKWTYSGQDHFYNSPVSHYVANYIRNGDSRLARKAINNTAGTRVLKNNDLIADWLTRIGDSEGQGGGFNDFGQHFPSNDVITTDRVQRYALGYISDDLRVTLTSDTESVHLTAATSMYRIFLLSHYLLRRCVINRLEPSQEEWGFDMFQALNATGTPLTAIETFLPQVMQAERSNGLEWNDAPSRGSFADIDDLFESITSNVAKTRRTNELLRTFALVQSGRKLPDKFSAQRRWITREYEQLRTDITEKRHFLLQMAHVAQFFRVGWYMEDCVDDDYIPGLEGHSEGALSSLLVQYLRDANSRLSATILARIYSQAIADGQQLSEFVNAAKACAAFFTLWRSARSTSGLDDIYRRFFSGNEQPVHVAAHNWMKGEAPVSAAVIRGYLSEALVEAGIGSKDAWMQASGRVLRYAEVQKICRFMLFVSGHDRVTDEAAPGLTKAGTHNVFPMLSRRRWLATDHKSIEHIAPQKPPATHNWDSRIYSDSRFDDIGNLLLVPPKVNSNLSNKEWQVKFLHYAHIGNRTDEEVNALKSEAASRGIVLSEQAVDALASANFSGAVEPVLTVGIDGQWDADMIDRRSEQIRDITWTTLSNWLGL